MNTQESKKITKKMVTRYFRIHRFVKTLIKGVLLMFFLLLMLLLAYLFANDILSISNILLICFHPTILLYIIGLPLLFASMEAIETVDLSKKKEKFEKKIATNKQAINSYTSLLEDSDHPTSKDLKMMSKAKKKEIKNVQLQFQLHIIKASQ